MSHRLLLIIASCLVFLSCNRGLGSLSASLMAGVDTSSFISMADAVDLAVVEVPGFPVAVALEVEDDDEKEPPAYEVVIFVSDSEAMMSVEVDAITGAILEVEQDDDGAETEAR